MLAGELRDLLQQIRSVTHSVRHRKARASGCPRFRNSAGVASTSSLPRCSRAMSVPRRSASRTSCVTKMEVFRTRSRSRRNWSCNSDARHRVERAEWLVEQQKLRIGRQRARHADALALAAGKLARIAIEKLRGFEAHLVEQLGHARGDALRRPALRGAAPGRRFRATVKCGNRARPPESRSRCCGAAGSGPSRVVARSSTSTSPAEGNSRPLTIFSAVVLPSRCGPAAPAFARLEAQAQIVEDEIAADAVGDVAKFERRASTDRPKTLGEGPLAIHPLACDAETRSRSAMASSSVQQELVRGLGPDGFAGAEGHRQDRLRR